MIELLTNGHGPAGMIFQRLDAILILGILISKVMLGKSIPVIVIPDKDDFMSLQSADEIHISHDGVIRSHPAGRELQALSRLQNEMTLSTKENEFLKVQHRPAAQIAMEVLVSYAALEGAPYLIDISQAHIDACCYLGPRSLLFAETLLKLGANLGKCRFQPHSMGFQLTSFGGEN
jgi:hypothetical protein